MIVGIKREKGVFRTKYNYKFSFKTINQIHDRMYN